MDIVILEESIENAGVFENLKGKASFLLTDAKASFDRLQFSSVIIISQCKIYKKKLRQLDIWRRPPAWQIKTLIKLTSKEASIYGSKKDIFKKNQ